MELHGGSVQAENLPAGGAVVRLVITTLFDGSGAAPAAYTSADMAMPTNQA